MRFVNCRSRCNHRLAGIDHGTNRVHSTIILSAPKPRILTKTDTVRFEWISRGLLSTLIAIFLAKFALAVPPIPIVDVSDQADKFSRAIIESTLVRVAESHIRHPSKSSSYGPDVGTFCTGLMAAYAITGEEKLLEEVVRIGEINRWKPGPKLMFPDHHIVLNAYVDVFKLRADPRMIEQAKRFVDAYLASPVNDTKDELITWWLCDYAFMDSPAFVKLARLLDRPELSTTNERLWRECVELLFDKEYRLFNVSPKNRVYPGFKGIEVGELDAKGRKIFWSCGNGWVLSALALTLRELPPDDQSRPFFEDLFKRLAGQLAGFQKPDGTWSAALLDPEGYPDPESTATGLLTHAFAYGVASGLLPREDFEGIAKRGWIGLNAVCVQSDFRVGWSEGSVAKPTKSYGRESYSLFSAGAFLLAGSEIARLSTER